MSLRLNLGAGAWRPGGYISVDMAGAEICHDLRAMPWPWADESVSAILASHVLEHFGRLEGCRFLTECWRILTPGGRLHLAVPDMDKFIACRLSGDYSPLGGYAWTDLNDLLGGGAREPRPEQRHQYMYCRDSLEHALLRLGFSIGRSSAICHNPAYAAISLYMDAVK
jgi:hypothetical protein